MMTHATALRVMLLGWTLLAQPFLCAAADKNPLSGKLLVFAAASTTEAIDEIRAAFVRLYPGVSVRVSYGASSSLAQQIAAGAQADLFLSASTEWAEFLNKRQRIDRQRDLLSNQLVIVTPVSSKLEIAKPADLAQVKIGRLALADPKSVPAGIYARAALEKMGLWKELESKVAGAADVRQALHFVASGAAEAGIVYATDAAASKAVRVTLTIDPKLSGPIRYPLVLIKDGADRPAAVALYDFLGSPAATTIFRRHGFIVPVPSDPARSGAD